MEPSCTADTQAERGQGKGAPVTVPVSRAAENDPSHSDASAALNVVENLGEHKTLKTCVLQHTHTSGYSTGLSGSSAI